MRASGGLPEVLSEASAKLKALRGLFGKARGCETDEDVPTVQDRVRMCDGCGIVLGSFGRRSMTVRDRVRMYDG